MYYVHYDLDCVCRDWVGGGVKLCFMLSQQLQLYHGKANQDL